MPGRRLNLSKYSNLCDHGTWTLQTHPQTVRRHTVASVRVTAVCVHRAVKTFYRLRVTSYRYDIQNGLQLLT